MRNLQLFEEFQTTLGIGESKKENIEGGLSAGMSLRDLARHHGAVKPREIQKMIRSLTQELNMGIKVELEHTENQKIAREIALDHLMEHPDYYTRLQKARL